MNKIRTILFLLIIVASFTACDKERERKISYFVTNSVDGFSISYRDADGLIQTTWIDTQSKTDKVVVYSYYADPGEIVYMSVTDTVSTSFVQAKIYVDDKVYKEASRTDNTTMPVTVSGSVPY